MLVFSTGWLLVLGTITEEPSGLEYMLLQWPAFDMGLADGQPSFPSFHPTSTKAFYCLRALR
jgi:hypothetical protein